jgi:hypothetical protein
LSENKLVGSLVLRTIDIDSTRPYPTALLTTPPSTFTNTNPLDNTSGTCTANGGVITWKNVNIRSCIGESYYKYNKFNLKLTAAQLRHNTANAVADAQFLIYISGLPFSSGSTYSTRFGPTNQSCIGAVNFVASTTLGTTIPIMAGLVSFDKPLQDVINITVELKNSSPTSSNPLVNGYAEKTTTPLGHWSLMCDIYAIIN